MIVKTLVGLFTLLVTLAVAACAQSGSFDPAAEQQLLRLLNDARQQAGLAPLTLDNRLTGAAREHSALMAHNGKLSHQFPGESALSQRLAATGMRFNFDAENVALDSGTAAEAHRGLMNSPQHRANILNPNLNAVGLGVVRKAGLIYVTEDFAHRLQEYSAVQAEDLAAKAFLGLRQRANAPAIQRSNLPELRNVACGMARQGRLATAAALHRTPARFVVSYTEGEPNQLPSNAVRFASDPALSRFAVGACYGRTKQYPSGTWWVVMVFY